MRSSRRDRASAPVEGQDGSPGIGGPPRDCQLCPRLVGLRQVNRSEHPDWYNGAVPSFGDPHEPLLIVGLAPGLRGANRTGRPFTGDYAGDLLYATLIKLGLAKGRYAARPDDGLELVDCAITNAVRCVPPDNKPTGAEVTQCRTFLAAQLNRSEALQAVLALGRIAHDSVVRAANARLRDHPFAHGARHDLGAGWALYDSYHCSRYNTNTGRLTAGMFEAVVARAATHVPDRNSIDLQRR